MRAVDNALDSFQAARLRGIVIKSPTVVVELPKIAELHRGIGQLCVRDNSLGMDSSAAEKALRAGFSGNNAYDSLGLFGMGFDISTGKFGRATTLLTGNVHLDDAIQVTVDLDQMRDARSYEVPVRYLAKPVNFEQGTLVTVSGWWPEGNPNCRFIRKLVQYGIPKVRDELGRRYSTLLRTDSSRSSKRAQVVVNGAACIPFEHCIWGDNRFVEHRTLRQIPAVIRFNELVGSQVRCSTCTALVPPGLSECSACGSAELRMIEERVRGWLGIQRYDDETDFGVDLIRNGRAIRISEKAAFFEFTDEFKRTIKDYPIDQNYGRVVGEVHLNHVPVDFLKQDFQRPSPEWQRAISYLRGDSSLQPKQPGAQFNKSPLYRLYQGYRRVRDFGKRDMYMGYWDPVSQAPKRISREVERELYDKFLKRLPGYYDDAEWWKHVEAADKKPLDELVECPVCFAANLAGSEACLACGEILIGKNCINSDCNRKIPISAESCPHCGEPQGPETSEPWQCRVCGAKNSPEIGHCSKCSSVKGTLDPMSVEALTADSNLSDELSFRGCTVQLADGSNSQPIIWIPT